MKSHPPKIIQLLLLPLLFVLLLLALTLPGAAAAPKLTYDTVSDAYLGSPYYEYLTSFELTGDQRTDVILVALSQLGYHEGNSDADTHGLNTAGSRNFVEYNRMYYPVDNQEGNGVSYGYHWCCAFATWCARQAGIPEDIAPGEISCRRLIVDKLQPMGIYHDIGDGKPRAGDFIFFCSEDGNVSDHIGIVLYLQGNTVHTIEGNTKTHNVAIRSYDLSDEYIVGYASPHYTENKATAMDFNPATGGYHLLHSAYYITASFLNVRTGPGVQYDAVGYLFEGDRVPLLQVLDGWGRIEHEGLEGWISLKYAQYTPTPVELPSCTVSLVLGGSVKSYQILKPGEIFTVPAPDPRKSDQPAAYRWLAVGWDTDGDSTADIRAGESITVTTSLTLTAIYERVPVTYTVRFVDADGSTIAEQTLPYGSIPTPPDMTGRVSAEGGAFDRWNGAMLAVTENKVFTAIYEEVIYCTVRFFRKDGTLVKEERLKAGETPTPPDDALMQLEDGSTFLGWDSALLPVEGDMDFRPRYEMPQPPPPDNTPTTPPPDDPPANDNTPPASGNDTQDTGESEGCTAALQPSALSALLAVMLLTLLATKKRRGTPEHL